MESVDARAQTKDVNHVIIVGLESTLVFLQKRGMYCLIVKSSNAGTGFRSSLRNASGDGVGWVLLCGKHSQPVRYRS